MINCKYKVTFNYRYGKDYVFCNKYKEEKGFIQPLDAKDGHILCTISKTNVISITTKEGGYDCWSY